MDVKQEELAINQVICKVCWKVSIEIKFHITVQDCDMGKWTDTGEGFSICDECFSGMTSYIDIKAGDIIDSMISSVKLYKDNEKGAHILRSIVERRIGDLTKLRDKLKEVIRDRRDSEKGGGNCEKNAQD